MGKGRALIALSGGVDSSVAAEILINRGYTCVGMTMLLHETCDQKANIEINDAREVANTLGIPFITFDFRKEFNEHVVNKFVNAYIDGITPNPCVECNKFLKFGLLYDKAFELGFDYVATGHYAKIIENDDRYYLAEADNKKKDQSYFLYNISEEILSRTIFPLGSMGKEEVRNLARKYHLPTADKDESQDICFVPSGDYASVIIEKTDIEIPTGDFVGPNGEFLGKHKGIIHYTVGQRKGLGVSYKEPLYVKKISAFDNKIYLGTKDQIFRDKIIVKEINWINGKPDREIDCLVRTRYHQNPQKRKLELKGDNLVLVRFDQMQKSVTPGQSAVFYRDDGIAIGGGIICRELEEHAE